MFVIHRVAMALAILCVCGVTMAQHALAPRFSVAYGDTLNWPLPKVDSMPVDPLLIESEKFDSIISNPKRVRKVLAAGNFRPVVFDTYHFLDPISLYPTDRGGYFQDAYNWLADMDASEQLLMQARQRYEVDYPWLVRYNQAQLPEVPKIYKAYVDPVSSKIKVEEVVVKGSDVAGDLAVNVDKKRWIHSFDASLQFSQAYISPNWYQGGNNNLNMIGQLIYNVKLNQKFYPKYLFEATVQYKLGFNNAPDDSIHAVNITEDLFQINATMGLKAARRWFYSANVMFKTQLLNSYPTNSRNLRSAFMSPGELNVGVGMTYNYTSNNKRVAFGASISPLSWNLKTCVNSRMDETLYDIPAGRKLKNKIGSSGECTLSWKVAYNIVYNTRLFAFTDYDYAYADWEHTIDFNINRFLTTRLYLHMRYDTSTPKVEGSSWHKFQFKEIFSLGFAYHFGTV